MDTNGKYNDRVVAEATDASAAGSASTKMPKPEISIMVDGNKIFKPGMKSVFIEDDESVIIGDAREGTVRGSYCSCNAVSVCTCNAVCTCESVCTCEAVCSCVGHCSCDQVCSCDGHCSCNQVCTCQSKSSGSYCSCVPVH